MKRDVPERYQALYERAMTGRSRRAAVRSFCLECVGYQSDEVKACTDPGCPLYPYRILSRPAGEDAPSVSDPQESAGDAITASERA